MTITLISLGCFLVLYCFITGLQQPVDSSFVREFFTLRRPQRWNERLHPDIFLWHTYTWFRWGLAAAIPFTLLDYLRRTDRVSTQNSAFMTIQFVLFVVIALGVLVGLYRLYGVLYSYLNYDMTQRLYQLWRFKWMQKLFGRPPKGDEVRIDLALTSEEAASGCEKSLTLNHLAYCKPCGGRGVLQGHRPHACPSCLGAKYRGSDRHQPCTTCEGLGLTFSQLCATCDGSGQAPPHTITVQVPAGVQPNTRLRIAEMGQPAIGNRMLPGDLYIYLSVPERGQS